MSALGAVGGVLAWPSDSGVAGGLIASVVLGAPAYVRHRVTLRRQHAERVAQADRHHTERQAQAAEHHQALKAALQQPGAPAGEAPSG